MDIRNLDLNLLKTLYVLLDEQSVSRAAQRLSLSQSAVSHALGKLRDHFNDPLLIKVQNGMAPTARAQELKIPLAGILEQIRDLTGDGRFDPAVEKTVFRISASDYGAGIILPRLLERMSVAAPRCAIECRLVSDHLAHDLRLGLIDLALGGYRPFDHFSHEVLFDDRYVGVVRSGHPILDKEIEKSAIAGFPHAYIAVSANTQRKDELYKSLGITQADHIIVSEPYFLVAPLIVEKSDLILIMPEMGARVMARIIDVVLFDLPTPIQTFPFIQVWHRLRDNDTMHQWFRNEVKTVCSRISGFFKS